MPPAALPPPPPPAGPVQPIFGDIDPRPTVPAVVAPLMPATVGRSVGRWEPLGGTLGGTVGTTFPPPKKQRQRTVAL